jgi:hypothetical protein
MTGLNPVPPLAVLKAWQFAYSIFDQKVHKKRN